MLVGRPSARQRGFTLIELMTTISILAILAAAAAPSFREFIANQRVRNASFDLMAALTLARSQAITLGGPVSLQPKGAAWSTGWVISDTTNTVFGNQEAMPSLKITGKNGNMASITYGKDGRLASADTTFTIEPSMAMNGVTPRCITVHLSGKPSSKQGAC